MNMPVKPDVWTESRLNELKMRYVKDGPKALAQEWEMTPYAVVAKARRMGLGITRKKPPKDFEWTEAMLAAIRDRYVTHGGHAMAVEFDVSLGTLRRKAAEMGLHTAAGHAARGKRTEVTSTSCNIRYFDTWSEDMAYILGFLFADGSIDRAGKAVRVNIAARDRCVLELIRDRLEVKSVIYETPGKFDPRTGRTNRPQVGLVIYSRVLVRSLEARGMKNRKTYNDDSFPDVPVEYLGDFTRGYFDGDGCVHVRNEDTRCAASFVGSVKFIRGLHARLVTEIGLRPTTPSIKQGKSVAWAEMKWTARDDLVKLRDFLYPDGHGCCLTRKKDKLVRWLSSPPPKPRWTKFDDDFLRRFHETVSVEQMATMLKRTEMAVRSRLRRLNKSEGS